MCPISLCSLLPSPGRHQQLTMTFFTTPSLDSVSVLFSSRCSRPLLPVEWSWFMSGNPFPELQTFPTLTFQNSLMTTSSRAPLAVPSPGSLACLLSQLSSLTSRLPFTTGFASAQSTVLHTSAPLRKRHRNYSGHSPLPPLRAAPSFPPTPTPVANEVIGGLLA